MILERNAILFEIIMARKSRDNNELKLKGFKFYHKPAAMLE